MKFYINKDEVSREVYAAHLATFGLTLEDKPPVALNIKPEKWPAILLPLRLMAKEGDRGAGDIIARVVGPIGGEAFKAWYKVTFGKECGCGRRQEVLNARWPL